MLSVKSFSCLQGSLFSKSYAPIQNAVLERKQEHPSFNQANASVCTTKARAFLCFHISHFVSVILESCEDCHHQLDPAKHRGLASIRGWLKWKKNHIWVLFIHAYKHNAVFRLGTASVHDFYLSGKCSDPSFFLILGRTMCGPLNYVDRFTYSIGGVK